MAACENGHVEVLRELRKGYGLTLKDASTREYRAMYLAFVNDRPEIKRELIEGFGIDEEESYS